MDDRADARRRAKKRTRALRRRRRHRAAMALGGTRGTRLRTRDWRVRKCGGTARCPAGESALYRLCVGIAGGHGHAGTRIRAPRRGAFSTTRSSRQAPWPQPCRATFFYTTFFLYTAQDWTSNVKSFSACGRVIGSISESPTACPLRGYGRAGTQNDRLEYPRNGHAVGDAEMFFLYRSGLARRM